MRRQQPKIENQTAGDATGGTEPDKLAAIAGGEPAGERHQRMPSGRRGARAVAVQALFESDLSGHSGTAACQRLAAEAGLNSGSGAFARELVGAVEKNRAQLDRRIGAVATAFPSGQVPAVDRNILRVALAETELHPETPRGVVITEAVEVARLLGSDSSSKFVHGVLGALLG
jgi:transcription antitermination protein NusB